VAKAREGGDKNSEPKRGGENDPMDESWLCSASRLVLGGNYGVCKEAGRLFRHPLKISILVWLGITTRYYTSCFHRFQLIPSCDMSILKCFP
jgi:hypothetical protein